jgi:hypothetical protein
MIPHPVLLRGALAIVTNVGRAAVDATASGAQERLQGEMNLVSGTRRVNDPRFSVRQNRVVLAPVAGVKSAEVFASSTGLAKPFNSPMTVTRKNSSPGRARHKP